MSEIQVEGRIVKVGDIQQVSDTFQKREVWVETNNQYPQTLSIEFTQDKAELKFPNVGVAVEIGINLRGRVWNGKDGERVFNTLHGWRIKEVGNTSPMPTPPQPIDDGADKLPF